MCAHSALPKNKPTLIVLLSVYCIDHVPPNPQDSLTPLMLAAREGHISVARLLVETYHCDVNEEDGKVSGWELMGRVIIREYDSTLYVGMVQGV